MKTDVAHLQAENPGQPVPVDLVTASGSGLDPNITLPAAEFQARRVARARGLSEAEVRRLVRMHTQWEAIWFSGRASGERAGAEPCARFNPAGISEEIGGRLVRKKTRRPRIASRARR